MPRKTSLPRPAVSPVVETVADLRRRDEIAAVHAVGALVLDRLVLADGELVALVEQAAHAGLGGDPLCFGADKAAVELGAGAGAVREHANPIPGAEVRTAIHEGEEGDEGAGGVSAAHAADVGERGPRLVLPDGARSGLVAGAEFAERRACGLERHPPEGDMVDVLLEVVVRDRLSGALDVAAKGLIEGLQVGEEARLAVACLDLGGGAREVRHLVGEDAVLARLQLEEERFAGDEEGCRAGAHHVFVGLAEVHAALIGGDHEGLGARAREA